MHALPMRLTFFEEHSCGLWLKVTGVAPEWETEVVSMTCCLELISVSS